ncbi:RING-H2 group F2A [Actinidia rufa]|uniref:RING-H2 group F2A n=1 Tax=Actinidia rufa TaxID=165716 RepID=A0A7J0GEN2_9ERIC|nr:RING-H2 group F2A [Actinidia rufa]
MKSRFNAMSMRYKESISKSTRGWKERLFSRSNTTADLGSEVRREMNAGMATVSRMMEHLETRENSSADSAASDSHNLADPSITGQHTQNNVENHHEILSDSSTAARAASSVSN